MVRLKAPDRLGEGIRKHFIYQRRHRKQKHCQQERVCRTHSFDCSKESVFYRKDYRKQDSCRQRNHSIGIISTKQSICEQDYSRKSDIDSIKTGFGHQHRKSDIGSCGKSFFSNLKHSVISYSAVQPPQTCSGHKRQDIIRFIIHRKRLICKRKDFRFIRQPVRIQQQELGVSRFVKLSEKQFIDKQQLKLQFRKQQKQFRRKLQRRFIRREP